MTKPQTPNPPERERCGIQKGMIFYLEDWITAAKIDTIEEILSRFLAMSGADFTKKISGSRDAYPGRGRSSCFRSVRGGWRKVFRREFDGEFGAVPDSTQSGVLTLANGDDEHPPTVYCFLSLYNFKVWRKASSEIYLQLPASVPWRDILEFITYVNQRLEIQFASAGYELGHTPLGQKPFRTYRLLKDLPLVNSYHTEWDYPRRDSAIQCPNLIQVFSKPLSSPLPPLTGGDIRTVPLENGRLAVHVLEPEALEEPAGEELLERLRTLNTLFQPILFQREKPLYLKPDEWAVRCKRFT